MKTLGILSIFFFIWVLYIGYTSIKNAHYRKWKMTLSMNKKYYFMEAFGNRKYNKLILNDHTFKKGADEIGPYYILIKRFCPHCGSFNTQFVRKSKIPR